VTKRASGVSSEILVHQSTTPRISLNFPTYILFPRLTGVSVRDRFLMLDCDRPWRARRGAVSNRRAHQVTDSESTSILIASVVATTWARYVRFSNRPFGVKRFQTIHHHSVDVTRGLVLLFGIGTKALPSWDSRTRWNNLWGGLAVRVTVGPSGRTNSPHPSSREGHHSTARWSSSFLLSRLILWSSHAAVTSRVHRNSVPSTQMRCMITANRRASATIAFFLPRCLAIFIAQALSQDHFAKRTSMI
jgi:hypothetical protein